MKRYQIELSTFAAACLLTSLNFFWVAQSSHEPVNNAQHVKEMRFK
jgi:hypothetical protein